MLVPSLVFGFFPYAGTCRMNLNWITKINNKLKFKNFVFQFRTRDYVPHVTKSRKLFNIYGFENFKIVCLWKKILGFLSLWKEFYSSSNKLCFSWYFTYKTKNTCCVGEERFFEVSVFYFVIDLILSIICGHVYFLFLVFDCSKKIQKQWKFSKR